MRKRNWITLIHTSGFEVIYNILLYILARGKFSQKTSEFRYYKLSKNIPYDAIIVPGAPYNYPVSKIFIKRFLWSIHLYKLKFTKTIIYSGNAVHTPYIESEVMAWLAEKGGVESNKIFKEVHAEHTVENLIYSLKIAKERGLDRIAIASDPLQCKFLQRFANKHKIEIDFLPLPDKIFSTMSWNFDLNLPEYLLIKNFIPLSQRKTFREMVLGTLGSKFKKLNLR